MPDFKVVTRDYKNRLQPVHLVRPAGPRERTRCPRHELRDRRTSTTSTSQTHRTETWDGKTYPSLDRDDEVCDAILHFATVTNGELAYRSYKNMEEKTGLPLAASGGEEPRRAHVVQGPPEPAAAVHQQPDVVGLDREWPGLFAVHLQRRGDRALADADRPAALLSRSSGLPRVRRAPADLQAEAAADAVRRPAVQRDGAPATDV